MSDHVQGPVDAGLDLVHRLRAHAHQRLYTETDLLMSEAALEIERLQIAKAETKERCAKHADDWMLVTYCVNYGVGDAIRALE